MPLRGIPLSCEVGAVPLVVGGGGGVVGKSLVRFVTRVLVGDVGRVMEVGEGTVCLVGGGTVCLVGEGTVSLFTGLVDVVTGSDLEETGVSLMKEKDGVVVVF